MLRTGRFPAALPPKEVTPQVCQQENSRQATAGRYLREASELARAFPSAGFSLLFLRAVNRLWSLNGKRRPERTEEAQWNLVLSIADRGHAGHRLQLLAPVPGCQRTLQGSWDLSRASFYLARFASSKSNYCKIRKIKLAISTMAVTPTTESTNACVAAW